MEQVDKIRKLSDIIRELASLYVDTTYNNTPQEYFDVIEAIAGLAGVSEVRWDGNQPDAYRMKQDKTGFWWPNFYNATNALKRELEGLVE